MTEVLLFHHVLGRTPGMEALAERFRTAGHTVHLPDLFEGRTFPDREHGRAYAQEVGFETLVERGRAVAETLPPDLVYAGVSLGALHAQQLTQTRPGARGALLVSAAVEPGDFDAPWPTGVPVQVHVMADDPLLAEGDLDAAQTIVATVPGAELYVYPGSAHLFTEQLTDEYDAEATDLLVQRAAHLLARV